MDSTFYIIFKHFHSVLRWFLLITLLSSIIVSLFFVIRKQGLDIKGRLLARITSIIAEIQFVAGLVVYFISPKVIFSASSFQSPILRFYLVEHVALMLVSVGLISAGYSRMKKVAETPSSSSTVLGFYFVALILILFAVPWPFRPYGGAWF